MEADPTVDVQPAENACKAKTKTTKPKKARYPPTHPPYLEMITEAIVTLKEKNESSHYVITKYIKEKQKQLPPNFKKMLLVQLRKLVIASKLVKFKASFKLPSARSKAEKHVAATAFVKKKPAPVKPKKAIKLAEKKNSRQAYTISKKAGHKTSNESWVPDVRCPVFLVFLVAGHTELDRVPSEICVVVEGCLPKLGSSVVGTGGSISIRKGVEKTSAAIKALKQIGVYLDAKKAKHNHAIRPIKGKTRNRRFISRKGPFIVHGTESSKLVKAFRNIPGVEIANVKRLNLLKLAPGGHLGRFIIWTKSTFEKLDSIYGSFDKVSEKKRGYVLPRSKMVNADLARIINSDEVQSVVNLI